MSMRTGRRRSDGMIGGNGPGGIARPRTFSVRDLGIAFRGTIGSDKGDELARSLAPFSRTSQGGGEGATTPVDMQMAADEAPMMIICYSLEDGKIVYINKEVYRTLGPDASIGNKVVDLLDPKFKGERDDVHCRQLFGVGMRTEAKKSTLELKSAAGNPLPAVLVMRANPAKTYGSATLFPGHAFQADFLDWQTSKSYRAAVSAPKPSINDIGGTSEAGASCKPIFVEMDALRKITADDKVEWREVAHWKDGLEHTVQEKKDGEMAVGKAHLSTVKFHDFIVLRKLLMRGTVLLDLELPDTIADKSSQALHFIASAIVADLIAGGGLSEEQHDQVMQVIQAQHVHAVERRKKGLLEDALNAGRSRHPTETSVTSAITPPASEHDGGGGHGEGSSHGNGKEGPPDVGKQRSGLAPPDVGKQRSGMLGIMRSQSKADNPPPPAPPANDDEACDVLAGTLGIVEHQVAAFVRLKEAADLGDDFTEHAENVRPPPVRFIFVVLGPPDAERETNSVAHAIACMMSNRDFANKAQVLRSKDDLLETIDGSIDKTNLTFAQNIEMVRERKATTTASGLCCGLFPADDGVDLQIDVEVGMPQQPGWLRQKRGSMVQIVEVPISAAPPEGHTVEVKTIEKPEQVIKLSRKDVAPGVLLCACALFAVLVMVFWHPHEQRRDVLTSKLTKFNTYITSPLLATERGHPLVLPLDPHQPMDVIDIKLVAACTVQDCGGAAEHRRRLLVKRGLGDVESETTLSGATWVRWSLYASHAGRETLCMSQKYGLRETQQVEVLESVDVLETPCADSFAHGEHFRVVFSTDSVDPLSVLAQAIQLGPIGRHRIILAGTLFVVVFAGIISEVIHRCYTTFVGSFLALGLLSLVHEVPSVHTVVAMIDAGTLMLLFAMMVNVHLLSLTGFFQWISVRVVDFAKGNTVVLFFLLANLTGFLSAFLDNVTCVLLIGPVTIKLCEQMGMNPMPFYLTETIAATIGGTATLIGDPPNVVIGNKLSLRFNDFIIFNGPLVVVIMPLAVFIQYLRFRHTFPKERVVLDMEMMRAENKIHDERSLFYLAFIFGGIFLGLFLFELHGHEPSWFCLLGMLGASIATSRHDIRHAIAAVEWDTLLFFAGLFVFVESLAEIGLIRFIGGHMSDIIRTVPIESRLAVAMVLFLWVSAIGSAFLESLPYTTTITFIIISLMNADDLEIPIEPLAWALSVGACVGGIGSIMGSSANLVSMAVSERYAPANPIKGIYFLQYGFPLLLVSISIATAYQHVLFVIIQPYK